MDRAMKSLNELLADIIQESEGQRFKDGKGNIFVAVESVYSMDGQIASLAAIVGCVEKHLGRGNGYIIVDEAHATGWLGHLGRGLINQLSLEDRIWARVHTFGKAMGCQGAIVLCSPTTRAYLINYAANLIYTTALGPPALTAIRVAYEHLSSGHAEPQRQHLSSLIHHTHRLLLSLVSRCKPSARLFHIESVPSPSPILVVYTSRARSLASHCQSKGFLVRPIVAPTVPMGTDRVWLCLHAANSEEQVRGLCEVMEAWVLQEMERKRTDGPVARL